MQRFVYTPRVEAFIKLEKTQQIIDVTDDIISGNVTRRLDAMSDAQLTLQNKHGRYTRPNNYDGGLLITPMDRIIIRMSRIGEPFPVLSGYIDDAPHFQLYPGPVTIRASCTLKLLQHTYFDPGLPAMTKFFHKLGWLSDPATGSIIAENPYKGFGNLDIAGGVRELIIAVLAEIAS